MNKININKGDECFLCHFKEILYLLVMKEYGLTVDEGISIKVDKKNKMITLGYVK
jgi:hypothetical protein